MTFEWPVNCGICGEPGKRVRHRVWTHAYTNPNASGPNTHAFVADVVFERADEHRKDAQFMRRFHRDELRESAGFEREVGRG